MSSPSIAANPKLRIPLLEENQSDPYPTTVVYEQRATAEAVRALSTRPSGVSGSVRARLMMLT